MKAQAATELYKASARTFEQLAFLLVTENIDEVQASAPLRVTIGVDFHGPINGTLILSFCGALDGVIAANMLGEGASNSEPQRLDALQEVANVVCGNFLPALAGADAVFRLDAPRPLPHDFIPLPKTHELEAQTQVGLEEGRALVSVYIKNQ